MYRVQVVGWDTESYIRAKDIVRTKVMKPPANVLRFTVPGPVVTNNLTSRVFHGRATKNPKATEYQSRVGMIAFAASKNCQWNPKTTGPFWVAIEACDQRADLDNIPKSILDGMKGIVYPDDRYVTELSVKRTSAGEKKKVPSISVRVQTV